MTLSKRLKEGTKKSHNMVENTSFIVSFLNGVIDKNNYKQLLANFYFIYSSIEEEFENNKNNTILKFINYSELNRKKSLEDDLKFFYGDDWEKCISPSPYTKLYVNRIKTLSENFPELLVAHHYTRYLGDLSGGQILKNIVRKSLKLKDSEGVSFYEFLDVKHIGEFKNKYKSSLDKMPVDNLLTKKIIEESNYAFKLNMNIFQEFEGNFIQNLFKFLVRIF